MNEQEVKKYVTEILNQSLVDQEIENPKVDCKQIWHELNTDKGKAEFVKDISAIANTVGLDGFIIIGYNDRTKTFQNADFRDSGLRDSSEIYSILVKHLDPSFDLAIYPMEFQEHYVNIVHIPPSLQKPHVIRNHRTFDKEGKVRKEEAHRIFVRKNTSIYEANRYDIELMYYDRKNIVPEFQLYVTIDKESLKLSPKGYGGRHSEAVLIEFNGKICVTFENTGRRPISLEKISGTFAEKDNLNPNDVIPYYSTRANVPDQSLLLPSQQIVKIEWNISTEAFKKLAYYEACGKMKTLLEKREDFQIVDFSIVTSNRINIKPIING